MFPNQKYLHKSTASFVRRKAFRVPGYLALEHMSNLGKGPDNQISYEAFTLLALQLSVGGGRGEGYALVYVVRKVLANILGRQTLIPLSSQRM